MPAINLSEKMLSRETMSLREKTGIVARLSMPGIIAQISDIIMQYIDAAMVGVLGASASASIGLVSSSTWLMGGMLGAAASGFSVQVAHAAGAGDREKAASIFKQSFIATLSFSLLIALAGWLIAPHLPVWLGAEQSLWQG
ncbi:MAG: MATE family efflux transporter, partial [Erysipelotrichaceae bacterium]|nr:MATE family efflux transporter [Erysipelotrichaceae bacterium]